MYSRTYQTRNANQDHKSTPQTNPFSPKSFGEDTPQNTATPETEVDLDAAYEFAKSRDNMANIPVFPPESANNQPNIQARYLPDHSIRRYHSEQLKNQSLNQEALSNSGLPIQAKMTIGEPGDKYEQEAAQVVNQIHAPVSQSAPGQLVQHREEGEIQAKSQITPLQQPLVQLTKLTPAQAAAQAETKRTANRYDRAAMTNDWILDTDEAATIRDWTAKAPRGYTYNSSVSMTGGGHDRPTSIDLKAKPTGAIEAEFIFHLPKFTGIPEMINYLIQSSSIQAKINEIDQISTINLSVSTDPQLQKIENAQKVDITPLTSHPIYMANSAEILAHDPTFLTDLQNQIGAKNAKLDAVRNDDEYTSRLANMKAKAAKTQYEKLWKFLDLQLLPDRSKIVSSFDGIILYMGKLNQEYAIASRLFSDTENQYHTELNGRFDFYKQIRDEFLQVKQDLSIAFDAVKSKSSYNPESWSAAAKIYRDFGKQFKALKSNWTIEERKEVGNLLKNFYNELTTKKPVPTKMDEERKSNKRERDED